MDQEFDFEKFFEEGYTEDGEAMKMVLKDAEGKGSTPEEQEEINTMLKTILVGDKSIEETLGIPKGSDVKLYVDACDRYENGKYNEAESLFLALHTMYPEKAKHSFGLASAQHKQGKYETALMSYLLSGSIDPDNPLCQYHAADCWYHIGQKKAALNALGMAYYIALGKGDEESEALIEAIGLEMDRIADDLGIDPDKVDEDDDSLEQVGARFEKLNNGEMSLEDFLEAQQKADEEAWKKIAKDPKEDNGSEKNKESSD